MRLTLHTFLTLDGVLQAPGGPDEDRDGGFEHGGWSFPYGDEDFGVAVTGWFAHADAFLLGRKTYEIFAGSWGSIPEMITSPIGAALNSRPKYVASTTLTGPRWADTTVLSGDVAAAVRGLKAKPAGEVQVHGSGTLIRWLLEKDLVDEMTLLIVPVMLGQGTRLFPANGPDRALDLVESRADAKGVMIQVYRPGGRPRYAPAVLKST